MENQHQKIKGYRDLSQEEIDLMNQIKAKGEELGELVAQLDEKTMHPHPHHVDKRWLSIGQTHLQQGLMALVRAVAKPESF